MDKKNKIPDARAMEKMNFDKNILTGAIQE